MTARKPRARSPRPDPITEAEKRTYRHLTSPLVNFTPKQALAMIASERKRVQPGETHE